MPLPALGEEATYSIDVDCYNNIVTVYRASDGAGGAPDDPPPAAPAASPSPQGNYVMPEPDNRRERKEWYIFAEGYGKYASRIWGNYLFHSYLFNAEDDAAVNQESVISMGTNASHGCIRLYIDDAKWISENCLPGTKVRLFWGSTQELYLKELLICDTFRLEDWRKLRPLPGRCGKRRRNRLRRYRGKGAFSAKYPDFPGPLRRGGGLNLTAPKWCRPCAACKRP